MKRTHKISSDIRSPTKTLKLDPINQKKLIKPSPGTLSPILSTNMLQLENSPSPKLTRNIKSQVEFTLTPRAEKPKNLISGLSTSKSPSKITEQISSEKEIKTESAEAIINQLRALKKEADKFKVSYTKTAAVIFALEKKLFRTQFKEKNSKLPDRIFEESKTGMSENLEEIEDSTFENDNFEGMKKKIAEQAQSYSELEELYHSDIDALKKDLERMKVMIKSQEIEIITLKGNNEVLSVELQDMKKKLSSEIFDKENQKLKHEDLLADKNSELAQMIELTNKIKIDRKNKDDALKDFQRQVLVLTNCNKILDTDLNSTKRSLALSQESLENELIKNKILSTQSHELSELLKSKENSDTKLRETLNSLDFVTNNYQFLQNKYNSLKEDVELKEAQLRDVLEKLQESSPTLNIQVKPKLRRMSTFNSASFNNDSAQKDTFTRLYSKITNLEEELQSEKIEKEKLNRNLEYLKKLIDEKLLIISRLEAKVKSDYLMQIELVKENLGKEVKALINLCEETIFTLQQLLTCAQCKLSTEVKFISLNCGHLFCKPCAMFKETCPACTNGSRILKLKLLKQILPQLPKQLGALSSLRALLTQNLSLNLP